MDEATDSDADEFTPTPVDYSRKTELAKEKAAREIDRIAFLEELQQRALEAKKYTYGWFKTLLELEALNSNANALDSKEVSISFARVERELGTQRTLVLKQPSRYIPQFVEDLADIPLVLHFGTQTRTLAIEVANVKSYTLRVKLKSHVDVSDIDFSKVTEARIDAKSPVFLLGNFVSKLTHWARRMVMKTLLICRGTYAKISSLFSDLLVLVKLRIWREMLLYR